MDKRMALENRHRIVVAMPNTNVLGKDLVGAFLILILFLLMVGIILIPEILKLFDAAMSSRNIPAWAAVLGSVALAGSLVAFPIFLIIQGFIHYRDARTLDRSGILTKGSISEKWVDMSNGKPIYQVQYKYSSGLNALQTVNKEVFQQLTCDQSIDVLHLQHAPHVSRLELGSL